MPKGKTNVKENTNVKKKPHIVLGLLIVVLLIPIIMLAAILVTSLEDSSQPVVGSRYQNELDPAITEENITSLENALVFDGTDSIEVNFKTARVAILIDTSDDMSADSISTLIQQVYAKVNEVLPIETYFTNRSEGDSYVKMYDLQIDAYNVISGDNQIHYVLTKTGAQSEPLLELVSSPKNEEVANDVQNQNTNEGE